MLLILVMPKLPRSWWDELFDGKVHHLQPEMTPYGTIASLRTSVYREAVERGIKVTTSVKKTSKILEVRAVTETETVPLVEAPLQQVAGARTPVSADSMRRWAIVEARAKVKEAGLDSLDQDLVEERLYCTCGLGNATEGKVHDPGCGVWS